eukprot:7771458-Pyramimonas_sp.AAC.1
MSSFVSANPHCEDAALPVKQAADAEPAAGQPAFCCAGAPMSDAHAYMMSQDTKGISFSINEQASAFTIQSVMNSTSKNRRRSNMFFGTIPAPADQDVALRNLQATVYQAI